MTKATSPRPNVSRIAPPFQEDRPRNNPAESRGDPTRQSGKQQWPAGRLPGLAIHLLEGRRYRTAPESRAFTGWTEEEIHTALNEPTLSAATSDVLARVGRALGAREGTGPDDMPWLHAQCREARAEAMNAVAGRILASRGMPGFESPLGARELGRVTDEKIVDALLQCESEADFRDRLRVLRRQAAYRPTSRTRPPGSGRLRVPDSGYRMEAGIPGHHQQKPSRAKGSPDPGSTQIRVSPRARSSRPETIWGR